MGKQIFSSSHGTNKSKGVAILFKPSFPLVVLHTTEDNDSRYLILQLQINNQDVILINVYGPNIDSRVTFLEIAVQLHTLQSDAIVW